MVVGCLGPWSWDLDLFDPNKSVSDIKPKLFNTATYFTCCITRLHLLQIWGGGWLEGLGYPPSVTWLHLQHQLQLWTDSRHLCSTSSAPQLVQPWTHHITFADRAFSCYAPRKWNQLPPQISNAYSITIFKRLLESHLFELAYGQ